MSSTLPVVENDYLQIVWPSTDESAGRIEKFSIDSSSIAIRSPSSVPLNGKMIQGTNLSIDASCRAENIPDMPEDDRVEIVIDIHATQKKLSNFGDVGSTIEFVNCECTDEWQVLANLFFYECIDMLDTEIKVLERTTSSVLISISGRLSYFTESDGKPEPRNPVFCFEHEIKDVKFVE